MTAFELIPSMDLLGGRGVRLRQGRYDEMTVYAPEPAVAAARFAALAPRRFHVVDLDGAREGRPGNREAVQGILAAMKDIPVQLGGGIRSLEAAREWLELGIERVILGTVALRDPDLVREAAREFPGRIGVGIDARDGRVAVEGWLETSDTEAVALAREFEDAGVAAIVHTDISRDGMGTGPNLEATSELAAAVGIPVIASGGVGSLDHVREAARRPGIAGLIVGRAFYDGSVDPAEALEAACS